MGGDKTVGTTKTLASAPQRLPEPGVQAKSSGKGLVLSALLHAVLIAFLLSDFAKFSELPPLPEVITVEVVYLEHEVVEETPPEPEPEVTEEIPTEPEPEVVEEIPQEPEPEPEVAEETPPEPEPEPEPEVAEETPIEPELEPEVAEETPIEPEPEPEVVEEIPIEPEPEPEVAEDSPIEPEPEPEVVEEIPTEPEPEPEVAEEIPTEPEPEPEPDVAEALPPLPPLPDRKPAAELAVPLPEPLPEPTELAQQPAIPLTPVEPAEPPVLGPDVQYPNEGEIEEVTPAQLLANLTALSDEDLQATQNPALWEVIRAIRKQMRACWLLDPNDPPNARMTVDLKLSLDKSGRVLGAEIQEIGRMVNDEAFKLYAVDARRALLSCSPFELPSDKYYIWRSFTMRFVPINRL